MEGDICPLKDLVAVAKELFPNGNAQFVIDEAHSSGVLGPKGSGLVSLEVDTSNIVLDSTRQFLRPIHLCLLAVHIRLKLTVSI